MTFEELATHCEANIIELYHPLREIYHLLTDSRNAIIRPESVFFAISGKHHDGHTYIEILYQKGCRQFVVEKKPDNTLPDANICLVKDSIQALQKVVIAHRNQYLLPVIGITGSNGKTIVKEWLSQMLAAKLNLVKSPKSYNSQIGVPLSVWQIKKEHEIAVFEAGISLPGEMEKLEKLIQPDIGIFTNLGPAHDLGFRDRHQKAQEKSKLFRKCKIIIYKKDYAEIEHVLRSQHTDKKLINWSLYPEEKADLLVKYLIDKGSDTQIIINSTSQTYQNVFHVPFRDDASLENIVHCIVYLLYVNWKQEDIQNGLDQLRQVQMRMELKEGVNQCSLLDDSYSNDLSGLKIALDYLQSQTQNNKRTVILSDLLESGYSDAELYQEVLSLLKARPVDKIILIGKRSAQYSKLFDNFSWEFNHFPDTESFLEQLKSENFQQENILIKGARTFGFERIVKRLQQKITSTTLEINLDAIIHNLNYYRSLIDRKTKMMVMVKAFSYGGATFEIANLLQYHNVDYLAVAYADEGVMLRKHGIRTPILVLNPSEEAFSLMVEHALEPEIYSIHQLHQWVDSVVKNTNSSPPIHLKIDTGMHRLGFVQKDIKALLLYLNKHPGLKIKSIFSHLVGSEDPLEDDFTLFQIRLFEKIYKQISEKIRYTPLKHILNSGGIQRFTQFQFDLVRLGIGLYGIDVSAQVQEELRPISTLKTVISQIKQLPLGETVGYNRKGIVDQPKRIATLAIGYADGLDRRLGNDRLSVWINKQPAPTIGNICMDMCMVDISNISAEEGDEVIIFGDIQPVSVLANAMQTIPYEVLTGISTRVKRIYYTET